MKAEEVALLERFVLDNPDLERLEAILDEFNPFVAMRWTRQETRHSCFLRWLLDPSETHGLGPYFLRQFVKYIASISNQPASLSVVDLDSWSYMTTQVLTEWNNIDLLIRDDTHKLIVLIENKVDSSEHSDQLNRYRSLIEKQFPQHHKFLVYLTVDSEIASNGAFIALGYPNLIRLVRDTIKRRQDQMHPSVSAFMESYVEMLRRHIVEASEIQTLCEKIYKTHRRALEILFEYQPDRASELKDYLIGLIGNVAHLQADYSSKSYIRFIPKSLDFLPLHGEGWTLSKRMILIEIDQSGGGIKLKLLLGPGRQETRERIHAFISKQPTVFNRAGTKYYPRWWSFHSENWVTKKEYDENDIEDLKQRINARFGEFITGELRQMVKVIEGLRGESWG